MSRIGRSASAHYEGEISRGEPPSYVRITPSNPTPTNHRLGRYGRKACRKEARKGLLGQAERGDDPPLMQTLRRRGGLRGRLPELGCGGVLRGFILVDLVY